MYSGHLGDLVVVVVDAVVLHPTRTGFGGHVEVGGPGGLQMCAMEN